MNANGNLVIDFRINGKHDHYINNEKHVQPHQPKRYATKPKKLTHPIKIKEIEIKEKGVEETT